MGSLLIKAALTYFEAHPEQVVNLLEQVIEASINALKNHNATQAAAK